MQINENLIEYGEGQGNPFHYFKNVYYDKRFIGRTFYNADFLQWNEITEIYFPYDLTMDNRIKYGIQIDNERECNMVFKAFANEIEAVKEALNICKEIGLDFNHEYPKSKYLI